MMVHVGRSLNFVKDVALLRQVLDVPLFRAKVLPRGGKVESHATDFMVHPWQVRAQDQAGEQQADTAGCWRR